MTQYITVYFCEKYGQYFSQLNIPTASLPNVVEQFLWARDNHYHFHKVFLSLGSACIVDIRFGFFLEPPTLPKQEIVAAFLAGMTWPTFDMKQFVELKQKTGLLMDDYKSEVSHDVVQFNLNFGALLIIPHDVLDNSPIHISPPKKKVPPPKGLFLSKPKESPMDHPDEDEDEGCPEPEVYDEVVHMPSAKIQFNVVPFSIDTITFAASTTTTVVDEEDD